jgi:hypothetical protein
MVLSPPPPWRVRHLHVGGTCAVVEGIGPLAGERIGVAGQGGCLETRRTLPSRTPDGWMVQTAPLHDPPDEHAILLGARGSSGEIAWHCIEQDYSLRAVGFSPTCRALVVASSHTIGVWTR